MVNSVSSDRTAFEQTSAAAVLEALGGSISLYPGLDAPVHTGNHVLSPGFALGVILYSVSAILWF
jgi:hypothetical protein